MNEVKCACGNSICKVKLKIEVLDGDINLWFTDKEGHESLMYLSPDGVVKLIRLLKWAINEVI